jgi:GntP family gluconate:H+ symporter
VDPLVLAGLGIVLVATSIVVLRLDAFLALVLTALIVGALTPAATLERQVLARGGTTDEARAAATQSTGERVARAFGRTAGNVGVMIALAAVIGRAMLESGAADRIIRTALQVVGERLAPIGFSVAGFVLAIPVFFDTVFYLTIPLGRAMALRNAARYGLYVMTIAGGGTIAHSLVPPTPGPLFVATALDVDVGQMMIVGIVLGLLATMAGWAYAYAVDRRWPVPLRETPDMSLDALRAIAARDSSSLPSVWWSLLPVLLPVALIGGQALLGAPDAGAASTTPWLSWLRALGDRHVALTLAMIVALGVMLRSRGTDALHTAVPQAIAGAGTIILVTSAGGAFGSILQDTGIGERLQSFAAGAQLGVLPLAFLATALIRTAQGSATVAMVTVVGMVAGLASPATLGFAPVYLAAAIGFGSKPFSWMNDSGFWVVSRMSGMTPAETLRNFSTQLTVMGVAGLLVTMLAASLFPLI